MATTNPRQTSEYSCVRLPIASPITVRLPDELTGKPWVNPFSTLAVPSASNSWLLSSGSRRLMANARAVSTLSL